MTDLNTLASMVEAATGPDRELDLRIGIYRGEVRMSGCYTVEQVFGPGCENYLGTAYTASLDAAMTLVPEGNEWGAGNRDATGRAWAWTGVTHDASAISNAATPALALTAAALRRAAMGEG